MQRRIHWPLLKIGTKSQDISSSGTTTLTMFSSRKPFYIVTFQYKNRLSTPLRRGITNIGNTQHVYPKTSSDVDLMIHALGRKPGVSSSRKWDVGTQQRLLWVCLPAMWDWMSVFALWGTISGKESQVYKSSVSHYSSGDLIMAAWWGKDHVEKRS